MTVKELIEKLSILNPDKPVVICDADTNWFLSIENVCDETACVSIDGDYGNMWYPPDTK